MTEVLEAALIYDDESFSKLNEFAIYNSLASFICYIVFLVILICENIDYVKNFPIFLNVLRSSQKNWADAECVNVFKRIKPKLSKAYAYKVISSLKRYNLQSVLIS